MHLTTYTEHAFRVLMYLATHKGLVTISEIADTYQVSRHHIAKVVHHLGLSGYVETHRGHKGGIMLAKEAADINAGDVVQEMERDVDMVKCMNKPSPDCPFISTCGLKRALIMARQDFLASLNRFTLADLILPSAPLDALELSHAPSNH